MPQGLEIDFLLPRDETVSDVNMLGDGPVAICIVLAALDASVV